MSKDVECCGGEEEGVVYRRLPGKGRWSTFQSMDNLGSREVKKFSLHKQLTKTHVHYI